VVTGLLIGVWQPTLLAFKLVRVESVEYIPVDASRRLERALAVGAVVVIFQPSLDAFAAKK